ncbi:flagellar hook capping FlgD N-terminal domain-containing protein [Paracoccus sp. S3-43]|uniref:flagellar hook capping FlgD N-terminal domain-containing protein n=1 Tax=Paracoccus sp. S3-43 TaxID=3030011 RepID=UPI0023AFDB3A|nr:flagellar hook capping FlgD N-terminal domain-containing protein [Paracoccus sp. S3-43]WEF24334.1 flagellar hook capping FlgD N-terminal domain-containing protein [Paracoccus sp. S3-43]
MVTPVNGSAAGTTGATSPSKATDAMTAQAANFDTFLRMLTTQLQNQDPLNPMEGSDFAVQLATFSGVEQQAQTNKLLEQMLTQSGGSLGQLAEWIGKEVRTTEPVWFGDRPLTLDVNPDSRADSVTLVTLNESGKEVLREEIGPGEGQIDWLGRDEYGEKLADGRYSFVIESNRAGEVISEDPVGAYVRVAEAEVGSQGIELIFEGGGSALASRIEALRQAN